MFFKQKAATVASGTGLQVGVMYPSGDMTVLFEREGVPRIYPRGLVEAIADQVNRHPDLYATKANEGQGDVERAAGVEPA